MRIRYVSGTLGMFFTLFSNAQVVSDTIKSVDLSEVVVTGSYRHAQEKKTTLTLELFQKDYLNRHFTGNLVQTLKNVRCFRFRCFLCWRFLLQHLMDALQQKLPLNRLRHIILRTKADCLPHQLIAVNRGNKNADTRKSPLFDVFQNP